MKTRTISRTLRSLLFLGIFIALGLFGIWSHHTWPVILAIALGIFAIAMCIVVAASSELPSFHDKG